MEAHHKQLRTVVKINWESFSFLIEWRDWRIRKPLFEDLKMNLNGI